MICKNHLNQKVYDICVWVIALIEQIHSSYQA